MKITVEKLTEEKLQELNVTSWGTWSCEVSEFDWQYSEEEQCYILEGHVIVSTDKEEVEIKQGDFVTFPKGLSCHWSVREPIRKHYRFV